MVVLTAVSFTDAHQLLFKVRYFFFNWSCTSDFTSDLQSEGYDVPLVGLRNSLHEKVWSTCRSPR